MVICSWSWRVIATLYSHKKNTTRERRRDHKGSPRKPVSMVATQLYHSLHTATVHKRDSRSLGLLFREENWANWPGKSSEAHPACSNICSSMSLRSSPDDDDDDDDDLSIMHFFSAVMSIIVFSPNVRRHSPDGSICSVRACATDNCSPLYMRNHRQPTTDEETLKPD